MASERQANNAIRFYEPRSLDYDDTWHPDFTKRFISYLSIQKGYQVLDLACGTGLLTFLEADAVGPTGQVIGIDVTPGMLAVAAYKKRKEAEKYASVSFYEGDVLHLEDIEVLKGKTFDVITVASALVLFPDPKAAIEHWADFLKPGGTIALDSTHPRNLVSGMVLERTARRLDLPMPYNREWSQTESSLKHVVESAGLEVEKVVTIDNQAGYGRRYYGVEEWDDFFVENVIVKDVARTFANNDIRRKAQGVFKEEWEHLAVDGKVEEVDAVFLGIARKLADGSKYIPKSSSGDVIFKGGCRCGAIQYTSTAPPSDITICHCRACQQISGSGFLPFIDTSRNAITFTSSSTLKTLKLSKAADRTFCTGCGAPIAMTYKFQPDGIGLTMGSVDLEGLRAPMPKVKQHIFLREKAPWVMLPDDGAQRFETSSFAQMLEPQPDPKPS